uniref:Cytochrome b561 domain-containing protein n=1 Tax=Acrobeloides nanus TaxID=290746 RepID=A0A914DLX7_9BILA
MVRSKETDEPKPVSMYSFHSWLGVTVFASYVIQFILGFINYAYPKTHIEIRRWFMPGHRLAGNLIFVISVVTVLVGHQRFWCFAYRPDPNGGSECSRTHLCSKRLDLIQNFSTIFILIYAVLVLIVTHVDEWKREETPDEKVHKE